jgi:hypothetical protein
MNTRYRQLGQLLLLPLLLVSGALAQAGESGPMDLPYYPPIQMQAAAAQGIFGRVVETMDAAPYTYVLLDTGKQKVWAAGPITAVKIGDAVSVSAELPMRHFHSKTLKRDFDLVYFSNRLALAGEAGMKASVAPYAGMKHMAEDASLARIKKADKGKTIAEIYSERKQLAGKRVRVRGKVMKYISNVFGKNWLHIQDGSSEKNLLVLTTNTTEPGAVVVAEGTVSLNKDNGIGHVYEVVLENASLSTK